MQGDVAAHYRNMLGGDDEDADEALEFAESDSDLEDGSEAEGAGQGTNR
jgi:hypothetical protein